MSDTSQGPGWWLASDGRWYPPEAWTGPPREPQAAWPTSVPPTGPPLYYSSAPGVPVGMATQTNGLAIASLISSCVGVVPFFFGLPCVLGIIFGFVARSQIRRTNGVQQGAGLALAGIIVGFALITLVVILIIVVAAVHVHTCDANQFCTN